MLQNYKTNMKFFKLLTIILLNITITACGGSDTKKNNFSIKTNAVKNAITNNSTLEVSINNPKKLTINSVKYTLDNKSITATTNLSHFKLGNFPIKAIISYNDGETETATQHISILNAVPPKVYNYEIINTYPHDITSYTQGLEFYNGELYESTGQYGESKLRKLDYKNGDVLENEKLANDYFGEGITVLNDKIYLLTWRKGVGFVYDPKTFKKTSSFKYGKSKEGWGLCNDKNLIYKSDGTERIWTLNPNTLAETDNIQVYTHKGKIGRLNELEWINGKIYANIYQKDGVVIINPKNGATEAVINFSPLKKEVKQHKKLDVLNGIAYNPETETIFVTGKHWNKLFEVRITE